MFEGYKVAVHVALQDGVTKGLLGMSSTFRQLGLHADALQKKLDNIKKMAMVGVGLGGAGFLGLGIMAKILKPAEEYAHQLNIMNMAGMKHQEISEAIAASWKTTHSVITSTAVGNLKTFMDMRNVFGNTANAVQYLPQMAMLQAVLKSSTISSVSQNSEGLAYSLAKSLDMRGVTNSPQEFNKEAEMMTKVIIATQGRVLPSDYQMFFKYARQSTYGLSDRFLYQELPTLMQEMKGNNGGGGHGGFGTASAAAYRFFVQGIMTKRSAEELQELGLTNSGNALRTTTTGTILKNGVKGASEFQFDPIQWTKDYLLPALHKKYGDNMSKSELIMAINQLRLSQTGAFAILQYVLKARQIERDENLIKKVKEPNQAYALALSNDPTAVNMALAAQWENLKISFGMSVIPIILPAIISLAKGFSSLAQVMRNYPNITKFVAVGFTALFAAMAAVGTLLLVGAGGRGLILAFRVLEVAMLPILAPLGALGGILAAIGVTAYAAYKSLQSIFGLYETYKSKLGFDGSKTGVSDFYNPNQQAVEHHSHIFLDGNHLATVVTKHQAKQANRQPSHGSLFNPNVSLQPNMLNYGGSL